MYFRLQQKYKTLEIPYFWASIKENSEFSPCVERTRSTALVHRRWTSRFSIFGEAHGWATGLAALLHCNYNQICKCESTPKFTQPPCAIAHFYWPFVTPDSLLLIFILLSVNTLVCSFAYCILTCIPNIQIHFKKYKWIIFWIVVFKVFKYHFRRSLRF